MVIYRKLLPRTKKRGVFYLSLKKNCSLNRLASCDEYPPGVCVYMCVCVHVCVHVYVFVCVPVLISFTMSWVSFTMCVCVTAVFCVCVLSLLCVFVCVLSFLSVCVC